MSRTKNAQKLSINDVANILAGLRCWQRDASKTDRQASPQFDDGFEIFGNRKLDYLCESINTTDTMLDDDALANVLAALEFWREYEDYETRKTWLHFNDGETCYTDEQLDELIERLTA